MSTPATCGSKYESNSCNPRKYHGAFDGLGWALGLASSRSGASWKIENTINRAVTTSSATNSIASRCGHTFTLSVGSRLTCWIAFALTTVSNRWVRTPSGIAGAAGAAVGAGAVVVAVGATPVVGAAAAPPVISAQTCSNGTLSALALASAERRSRCSGTLAMTYSGPEMPPSLRTRQKCTAMKMTMRNGSART